MAKATISVKRGDTLSYTVQITFAEGEEDAIGDIVFRAHLRNPSTGEKVAEPSITVDEAALELGIVYEKEVTETLTPGTYYTDLEATWPSGYRQSTETYAIKVIEDQTYDD